MNKQSQLKSSLRQVEGELYGKFEGLGGTGKLEMKEEGPFHGICEMVSTI